MRKWILVIIVLSCTRAYSLDDLYGGLSNTTITVKNGDTYQCVFGGYSTKAENTSNNTVTMTGGTVESLLGGQTSSYGHTTSGSANSNKVIISGGSVEYVTGGCAYGGDGLANANNNEVTVSGGTVGYIDGGVSVMGSNSKATANNNKVTIQGGTITGNVRAGYNQTGEASGNQVIVNGGTIEGSIEVAFISLTDLQSNSNSVIINDGLIKGNVTTASERLSSTNDRIEINGGIVRGNVGYGNFVASSSIAIQNSQIGGDIYLEGFSRDNTVQITNAHVGGDLYSGMYSYNDAVTITNSTIAGEIRLYGSNGSLLVNSGELQSITINQSDNTVTINELSKPLQFIEYMYRSATNNTLNLNNDVVVNSLILRGKIDANRVSGILDYQFYVPSSLGDEEAMITITGNASSTDVDITGATVSAFTDTGKLLDTRDMIVLIDKVSGTFEETFFDGVVEINPVNVLTKDSQLIATYGSVQGEKGEQGDKGETGDKGEQGDKGEIGDKGDTGDKGTTGDKGEQGDAGEAGDKGEDGEKGEVGDKGETGNKGETGDQGEIGDKGETGDKGPTGVCSCCTVGASDACSLEKIVSEQVKVLTYSVLGQVGLLNQSADMVVSTGLDRALASIAHADQGNAAAFFATSFGRDRYKTGGSVDVKGVSLIAGIAYAPKSVDGFAFGVFGEAGNGDFDGSNARLTGSGDNEFVGGGILARWNDVLGTGLYLDATARMGRSKVDFGADGFMATASGKTRAVHYDMRGNYYGAHFGVGKIVSLGNSTTVDVSAKYLWSHQKGDSVVAAGENLHIVDVDSHRIRAGARVRHAYNSNISFYGGSWLEHEFDGKASIHTVSGKRYQGGSIKGTSGVGELGISLGAGRDSRWLLDVGVTGHVGKRRGIGGNAGFSISF